MSLPGRLPAVVTLVISLGALGARSVIASPSSTETASVLDVPFVPQTGQLCGGASAAMVLRYWGSRGIHATDFAPMLEPSGQGIRGDVLVGGLRDRGWQALPFRGDRASVQQHLASGRPLVVLLQEEPGHYHYVVVIGWDDGRVTLHDSARAPFRHIAEPAFETMWAAAGSWTLLILPDGKESVPETPVPVVGAVSGGNVETPVPDTGSCDALVLEGVRAARAGDEVSADERLSTAMTRCPASAAARELAGLRFVQSRWQEAERLAVQATTVAPDDALAWRIVASSRFIQGDADGALDAWNQAAEPRVDLVRISGLGNTYYGVAAALIDLSPRTLLTTDALQRARRRMALLPTAGATRVTYRPAPGGLADVDVAIIPRAPYPRGPALAIAGTRALTHRELRADFVPPVGSGTRWTVAWRWWEARPRLGVTLEAPIAFGRSGLWTLEAFWERQSYAVDRAGAVAIARDDRRRLGLGYSDWVTDGTRVELGMGLDRWTRSGSRVATFGSIEQRLMHDDLAVRSEGAVWSGLGRTEPFATGGFDVAWRVSGTAARFTARAGVKAATRDAPPDVWPGADVGHARDVLARAHPLLSDGVISGPLFGRRLAHAGTELRPAGWAVGPVRLRPALFADFVRAWHPLESRPGGRTQVDVGTGLRVQLAGHAQTLRIDVAHGLRDGARALSIGWQAPWPDFP